MSKIVNTAILKQLNSTEQLQLAVVQDWTLMQVEAKFGAGSVIARVKSLIAGNRLTIEGVSATEYIDTALIEKEVAAGRAGKAKIARMGLGLDFTPMGRESALIAAMGIGKTAVPAATTANTSALYRPTQAAGVLLPPQTPSLITALAQGGAPALPPNTRLLTQASLLAAAEIPEGAPYPAAAPSLAFTLTNTARKFGLILSYSREMLAVSNYDGSVQAYVEGQLTAAVDNATDGFLVALMTSGGTAAEVAAGDDNAIAAVMAGFAGDLRSAVWIASPDTLVTLQSAVNPNIGATGGVYKGIQALPSLAAPAGVLFLLDRARVAVYDGALRIKASEQASIVMDTDPATSEEPATNLFQEGLTALKVTKYADAKLLSAPLVITLQ